MTKAMVTINPEINNGRAGRYHYRFGWQGGANTAGPASSCQTPELLRRQTLVPIATGFFCLIRGDLGYVWPPVQHAIHLASEMDRLQWALGHGIFWFHQPSADPIGLHQVLNTIAWSRLVSLNAAGAVLPPPQRHQPSQHAGDGTAGMFMSGFPIMMFVCRVRR